MDLNSFYNVVASFSVTEITKNRDEILLELPTGEIVAASIVLDTDGTVKSILDQTGTPFTPRVWIAEKLGRLSSLAKAIQSTIISDAPFVSPVGKYELNWSIKDIPLQGDAPVCDILKKVCETPNHWETHLIYITSNAGEGKTTVLEKVSSTLAKEYSPGRGRVVVPISLSGKPFIRFEDLVIGTLANKYKFSSYFFPSFLAMVRLGLIIPAFDGFEEMFVESPTGEAISSMAEFIKELEGVGTILVAARSAYFEHQNLTTQGKLYDSVSNYPVVFSKIRIDKWNKSEFYAYGIERAFTKEEVEDIYFQLAEKYGEYHPILTRAVFVRKIFDSFVDSGNINDFLQLASTSYYEFYKHFLYTIIDREAGKWLMKGKSVSTPVLNVRQHRILLSMVAKEMWMSRSEILRYDVIAMIADIFIESENLLPEQAVQVRKRVKDHAILKMNDGNKTFFEFDHQDFYQYFLGYSLFNSILEHRYDDILDLGRKGRWSKTTLESCYFEIIEHGLQNNLLQLVEIYRKEQKSSHARENIALLILLINQVTLKSITIESVTFDAEPFDSIALNNVEFNDCIISSFKTSNVSVNVVFKNCKILEIEYDGPSTHGAARLIGETEINSLHIQSEDTVEYAPELILNKLVSRLGYVVEQNIGTQVDPAELKEADEKIVIIEKVLRIFFNRIEVNEDILRTKLGKKHNLFWDEILPDLLGTMFEKVKYQGGGSQVRIRIIFKLERIQDALKISEGDYDKFVSEIKKRSRWK